MLGRLAAISLAVALAGCAGMESAGRNAARSPQPARVATAPAPRVVAPAPTVAPAAPPPRVVATAPTPAPVAAPAPVVTAAAPPTRAPTPPPAAEPERRPVVTASREDDDIVVPGQRERQVQPPNGDPRSGAERMQDIAAWDRCVVAVQSAGERDPMRPQLEMPEDYCARSLGMAERGAVPISRLERRQR